MSRDPRFDPQPDDVLVVFGRTGGRRMIAVSSVHDGVVGTSDGAKIAIKDWRLWDIDDRVVAVHPPADRLEIDETRAALAHAKLEIRRLRMLAGLEPEADNAITQAPAWFIVQQPRGSGGASQIMGLITGPFLSHDTGAAELRARPHRYPDRAVVYAAAGHVDDAWTDLTGVDGPGRVHPKDGPKWRAAACLALAELFENKGNTYTAVALAIGLPVDADIGAITQRLRLIGAGAP